MQQVYQVFMVNAAKSPAVELALQFFEGPQGVFCCFLPDVHDGIIAIGPEIKYFFQQYKFNAFVNRYWNTVHAIKFNNCM